MIILRYLTREILSTTLVISFAWLLFSIGRRFSQYLDEAWRGDLSSSVLLTILALRVPDFLTLVLPVGFFLGLFLAFGRLYVDNEMSVLSSCGISKRRILTYSLLPAAIVALLVGFTSLYLSPLSLRKVQLIEEAQANRSELEILTPNRFQPLSDGKVMVFFHSFNAKKDRIQKVFIAEMAEANQLDTEKPLYILTAEEGEDWIDPANGHRYLLLHNGYQYIGKPGDADYREIKFSKYGYYLPPRDNKPSERIKLNNVPIKLLIDTNHPAYKAELHWRFALPIMVMVITLLAVPLSHTNPRQGRFVKLLPAFFLFMSYLGLLMVGRGWIEEKKVSVVLGLWWVHLTYLSIAGLLLWWNNGQPRGRWTKIKRVVTSQDHHDEEHS